MGLRWYLADFMENRGLAVADLAQRLGLALSQDWMGPEPPADLAMADLALICEALNCQPGELLGYEPETPAAQAARQLERDLFYQSLLQHRAMLDQPD